VPGGDLVSAGDDVTGNAGHRHRVLDVLGSLAEVGAGDGHHGAALQGAGHWVNLAQRGNTDVSISLLIFILSLFFSTDAWKGGLGAAHGHFTEGEFIFQL